jgi:hypothetical protein
MQASQSGLFLSVIPDQKGKKKHHHSEVDQLGKDHSKVGSGSKSISEVDQQAREFGS